MCHPITPTRKPAASAKRTCQWLCGSPAALLLAGVRAPLVITVDGRPSFYWVERAAAGWRMLKEQDAGDDHLEPVAYAIDTTFGPLPEHWECTCPAATYGRRRGPCRHVLALAAALRHVGLEP